jgi:hypothetical protein
LEVGSITSDDWEAWGDGKVKASCANDGVDLALYTFDVLNAIFSKARDVTPDDLALLGE